MVIALRPIYKIQEIFSSSLSAPILDVELKRTEGCSNGKEKTSSQSRQLRVSFIIDCRCRSAGLEEREHSLPDRLRSQ